jgi:hypothetical protein
MRGGDRNVALKTYNHQDLVEMLLLCSDTMTDAFVESTIDHVHLQMNNHERDMNYKKKEVRRHRDVNIHTLLTNDDASHQVGEMMALHEESLLLTPSYRNDDDNNNNNLWPWYSIQEDSLSSCVADEWIAYCCGKSFKDYHTLIEHDQTCHQEDLIDDMHYKDVENSSLHSTDAISPANYMTPLKTNTIEEDTTFDDVARSPLSTNGELPNKEVADASLMLEEWEEILGNPIRKKKLRFYPCSINECDKIYTSNSGLRYHIYHGHKRQGIDVEKPHLCYFNDCNRRFKSTNGLSYHIRNNHARKQWLQSP